jgi:hypothetical protein
VISSVYGVRYDVQKHPVGERFLVGVLGGTPSVVGLSNGAWVVTVAA